LLIDTWSKAAGDLFDCWPADRLSEFAVQVRAAGIRLVLAGSLQQSSLLEAARYRPTLVAVRGAVCEGKRTAAISLSRVAAIRAALTAAHATAISAVTVNVGGLATSSAVNE
jgi:hypothetical protein